MPCVQARARQERAAKRVKVDRFAKAKGPLAVLKILHSPPPHDDLVEDVPYPLPAWEVYAELSPAEGSKLLKWAIKTLKSDEDAAVTIAASLACLTDTDMSPWHKAASRRRVFDPPVAYLGADPKLRARVAREHADSFDETAKALVGRVSRALESCYALLTQGGDSKVMKVFEPQRDACPWCRNPLTTMLDLDCHALELAGLPTDLPRISITTCHVCCTYRTVYCDIAPNGDSTWSPANGGEPPQSASKDWPPLPQAAFSVGPRRRPHAAATDQSVPIPRSQLGGMPFWLQFEERPTCPSCDATMTFVAQFDLEDLDEEGMYHTFVCGCGVGATSYQQT